MLLPRGDVTELESNPPVAARLADRAGLEGVQSHALEPAGIEHERGLLDLLVGVDVESRLEVEAASQARRRVDVEPRDRALGGVRFRPLAEEVRQAEEAKEAEQRERSPAGDRTAFAPDQIAMAAQRQLFRDVWHSAVFGGRSSVPSVHAALIHETGPPEVIRIEEVPDPTAGEGDVLVRVGAAGVNRFDVNQRRGGASSFPLVLGNPGDAAGTRVDTGERVVLVGGKGTYAELTVAAEGNVFALPDSIETATAAAVPTPYRTAWWGVVGRGELTSGQTLLVQGGSSATGQAAIDIGRQLGAAVFATASESNHDRLRELGAEPLAYDDPRVAELEADVVWEPLGARTFELSVAALGRDGRVITPGAVGDPTVSFGVWALVGKRGRIEGIAGQLAPREAVEGLLETLARGELHPWVERELPLDEAAEAHRLIEAGELTGRVVLRP
jgi:NADPH:quinone reductase-like Zn-dependent oxidoreductase